MFSTTALLLALVATVAADPRDVFCEITPAQLRAVPAMSLVAAVTNTCPDSFVMRVRETYGIEVQCGPTDEPSSISIEFNAQPAPTAAGLLSKTLGYHFQSHSGHEVQLNVALWSADTDQMIVRTMANSADLSLRVQDLRGNFSDPGLSWRAAVQSTNELSQYGFWYSVLNGTHFTANIADFVFDEDEETFKIAETGTHTSEFGAASVYFDFHIGAHSTATGPGGDFDCIISEIATAVFKDLRCQRDFGLPAIEYSTLGTETTQTQAGAATQGPPASTLPPFPILRPTEKAEMFTAFATAPALPNTRRTPQLLTTTRAAAGSSDKQVSVSAADASALMCASAVVLALASLVF
jgi:hypothetical protein